MSKRCACCKNDVKFFESKTAYYYTLCKTCYNFLINVHPLRDFSDRDIKDIRADVHSVAPEGYFKPEVEALHVKYIEALELEEQKKLDAEREKKMHQLEEKLEKLRNIHDGYELKYLYGYQKVYSSSKILERIYFNLENQPIVLKKESTKQDENSVSVIFSDGYTERKLGILDEKDNKNIILKYLENEWFVDAKVDSLNYYDLSEYRAAGTKGQYLTLNIMLFRPIGIQEPEDSEESDTSEKFNDFKYFGIN